MTDILVVLSRRVLIDKILPIRQSVLLLNRNFYLDLFLSMRCQVPYDSCSSCLYHLYLIIEMFVYKTGGKIWLIYYFSVSSIVTFLFAHTKV